VGWTAATFATFMACSPIVVDAFVASCPGDPIGTQPGPCGCGIPEDDFDGDGTPDCVDQCPDNAQGVAPVGACGCSSSADTVGCDELRAALRNLYTFAGSGTEIIDSASGTNGTLLSTVPDTPPSVLEALQQGGRLTLEGTGGYVDLPDGMISSLASATFEAWVAWRGDGPWARIFDFGNNGGDPVDGITYLFLTPANGAGLLRVAYSVSGPANETVADAPVSFPIQPETPGNVADHVAVVIDRVGASMQLYLNGVQVDVEPFAGDLGALDDVNNWLGRSNFLVDPALSATLMEFRVYSQALTPSQLSTSFLAGPGALD
jgi:hypothetical protein